jgi:N-acetylglucosaminyldiphosphoundecaprenol N-acetyl-beta-D-mannosaminyltransferase
MGTIRLLNGRFDAVTLSETIELVADRIRSDKRGYLCTVNVAILMMMRKDPRLQAFVDRAAVVVADGQPLIWSSGWLSRKLPERVAGVELVDQLCALAAREGHGVYLLGSKLSTAEEVARRLTARHPGLTISGIADGYFGTADAPARAAAVAASGAKILVVAMGVPRQEHFIEEQWEALGVPFAIGVGGSFDVLAGLKARAPRLLQRVGLEWAFRMAQEPRRLFKRYLVTNTAFAWQVSRALVTRSHTADRVRPTAPERQAAAPAAHEDDRPS